MIFAMPAAQCVRNPLPSCMETRSSAEFKELWIVKNKASFARRGIFGIISPTYLALLIYLYHQHYRAELLHCVNRYCCISTGSFYNVWVFGRRGISEIYYEYSLKVFYMPDIALPGRNKKSRRKGNDREEIASGSFNK